MDVEARLFTGLLPVMGGRLAALALAESGTRDSLTSPDLKLSLPQCLSHLAALHEFRGEPGKKKTCSQMPSINPKQTKEVVCFAHLCAYQAPLAAGWVGLGRPLPRWESPDGRAWDPETLHEGVSGWAPEPLSLWGFNTEAPPLCLPLPGERGRAWLLQGGMWRGRMGTEAGEAEHKAGEGRVSHHGCPSRTCDSGL